MNTLPDLRFDDRVLIVVPSIKFRDKLREPLSGNLASLPHWHSDVKFYERCMSYLTKEA